MLVFLNCIHLFFLCMYFCIQVLTALANAFHALQPLKIPGFRWFFQIHIYLQDRELNVLLSRYFVFLLPFFYNIFHYKLFIFCLLEDFLSVLHGLSLLVIGVSCQNYSLQMLRKGGLISSGCWWTCSSSWSHFWGMLNLEKRFVFVEWIYLKMISHYCLYTVPS